WSVAVNAAMAGCRPEHLPIALAMVEAVADPEFSLGDGGSTPGWETQVILSGPLGAELGFNSGAGALPVGRRANTALGRFLRLYLRNVAGFRPPPGATDKGSIGASFNVVLCENDAAVGEIGWPSFRAERGFAADVTSVTVQSVVASSAPI